MRGNIVHCKLCIGGVNDLSCFLNPHMVEDRPDN